MVSGYCENSIASLLVSVYVENGNGVVTIGRIFAGCLCGRLRVSDARTLLP